MKAIKKWQSFGGTQHVFEHDSEVLGCQMQFALFEPPQAAGSSEKLPIIMFLSGLTCSWANFVEKAGSQRIAAQLGCYVLAPDTSPRGDHVSDRPDEYDLGKGAAFYLNATQEPWKKNYQMQDYVAEELPDLLNVKNDFAIDFRRFGILGHSMGGHGAMVTAFRHPEKFRSLSALAPICKPSDCEWGQKAFSNYLGENKEEWKNWDACDLLETQAWNGDILIDQGSEDEFYLSKQLLPEKLQQSAKKANVELRLRIQAGYDHSYYFIASFLEDHFKFHYRKFI